MRFRWSRWSEAAKVASGSLVLTLLFFFEYLPLRKRFHFYSDIEGYHYPLLSYIFEQLRHGRFPEWDSAIYCGITLVGNIQAALFYPPTWLMFAANIGREHLSFKLLELFVILHVWLALFLCYLWLRNRPLGLLPSLFGAGVLAYSGWMMSQSNHVGVVTGWTWIPLALWGIDETVRQRSWRPMWKVTAGVALCFLAGFPATWAVFCGIVVVYALASPLHWRAALAAVAAIAASLPLVAFQLLPAREAAGLMFWDPKYGTGLKDPEFFVAHFIPNYFDFGKQPVGWGPTPGQYMYLGVPAIFALLWLLRRWNLRAQWPALAMLGASLFGLTNPFGLMWDMLKHSRLLSQMVHGFNFLEGVTIAIALLTAISIEDFLKRPAARVPRWLAPAVAVALVTWSLRLLWIWSPGGADFAARWKAAVEPAVMLVLFGAGLYALRSEAGRRWAVLAGVLLGSAAIEYKAFGTSRRFNAIRGDADDNFPPGAWPGFHLDIYRRVRANPDYRVLLDENASPHAVDAHHFGFTTPQGFDPFLPAQYRDTLARYGVWRTDRLVYFDPENEAIYRLTGTRFFVTRPGTQSGARLRANPKFRLLEPSDSYFQMFEYLEARPSYYWESGVGGIERLQWTPDDRELLARSSAAGKLVLAEQYFPGWRATVDGSPVPIEKWGGAFQAVRVPAGEHRVRFEFRSPGLRIGAPISVAALVALVWFARRRRAAT
jgi:hypothetical protein